MFQDDTLAFSDIEEDDEIDEGQMPGMDPEEDMDDEDDEELELDEPETPGSSEE